MEQVQDPNDNLAGHQWNAREESASIGRNCYVIAARKVRSERFVNTRTRGDSLSDGGSWMTVEQEDEMEAEARSVNDIRRAGTRRYPREKVYGCTASVPPRSGGGLGARRIEFYFHSGESGVVPHTGFHFPPLLPLSDAEEHQLIRRTPFFLFLFRSPHNPLSQTSRFHEASRFGGTSRRVSFLSSFPYWFTDQVSKRYDSFLLFFLSFSSSSSSFLSRVLSLYIYICLFHFISLASSLLLFLSFLFFYSRR